MGQGRRGGAMLHPSFFFSVAYIVD